MVRVVYVAGIGRSGSTLVGRVLAQNDDAAFVGEARTLPTEINTKCGCGQKVRNCRLWSHVLESANISAVRQARNACQVRELAFGRPEVEVPLHQLAQYYQCIQRASGARTIVDSSKFPSYLLCLSESPGIDVKVLHLIRDPRAIAYSWWRRPLHENKQDTSLTKRSYESLRFENPVRSSLIWTLWNYVIEKHWKKDKKYYNMKYEDFCRYPKQEVDRATEELEIKEKPKWTDRSKIHLSAQHSIRGNPNRFADGIIEIEERSDWRADLSSATKLLVGGLTFPLLRQYGYSFKEAWG